MGCVGVGSLADVDVDDGKCPGDSACSADKGVGADLVVRPGPDWDPRQSRTPPKVAHPSLLELLILKWRKIISPRHHQVLRMKRASLANC